MSETRDGVPADSVVVPVSLHPLLPLFDPRTIRARCLAVTQAAESGVSPHFTIDRDALPAAADRVAAMTRRRFPDLEIPFHSRWRHFAAGGRDRKAELDERLAGRSPDEVARSQFDLTVLSVLLDAGAGASWRYTEGSPVDAASLPGQRHEGEELLALLDRAARAGDAKPQPDGDATTPAAPAAAAAPDGDVYSRSEGLGVATFHAFLAGVFAAGDDPLRADAETLKLVDTAVLRGVFQVGQGNAMVGLDGRAGLIKRLGEVLALQSRLNGLVARPAMLYDLVTDNGTRKSVAAADVLVAVLRLLSPIFTSGTRVQGLPAGDVWPHRWAGSVTGGGVDRTTGGYVPFHKLSQWLSYSLIEPLQWSGVEVTGLDELTGLPEYRNGGLLIDCGAIVPRDERDLARHWKPGDEFVVEWRALTVTLLDELAVLVRERLGRSAEQLPLACILEGGTWAAGREIAAERRADGAPPLIIDSDGTLF